MSLPIHTLSMIDGGWPVLSDRLHVGLFSGLVVPPSANAITAVGAVTAGTGYTSVNTISVTPTGGTGSGLQAAVTSLKCVAAAVAGGGGGTGYVTNDTINMGNGVVLTVTAAAGVITALAITNAGACQSTPANPVSPVSTSGAGVGAKVNMTWGLGTAAVLNSGSYTVAPTGFTVTDSAAVPGTGGAIGAPTLGGNGATVFVGVSGLFLPLPYAVQVTPSMPAFASVPVKTSAGFTIGLTPIAAGGTLAGGTADAVVIG